MTMLKVDNLSVHYGVIQAVKDVSFEVNEGEVVTLIGANGAGKTSILRTISGLVRPSAGKIEFLGQEIQKVPAQKIVAAGLSQVPEGRHVFPGLTVMEALNTDLVCDAINTAMRELFLQIVYGRTQSAFSEGGLAVGAGLEDLGKGLRSQVGTMYGTLAKGPRYLEMAEGYVTGIALDKDDQIIGYKFVNLGKMTDFIKKGDDPNTAYEKAAGQYGRVADAVKIIDPRTDEEVK